MLARTERLGRVQLDGRVVYEFSRGLVCFHSVESAHLCVDRCGRHRGLTSEQSQELRSDLSGCVAVRSVMVMVELMSFHLTLTTQTQHGSERATRRSRHGPRASPLPRCRSRWPLRGVTTGHDEHRHT